MGRGGGGGGRGRGGRGKATGRPKGGGGGGGGEATPVDADAAAVAAEEAADAADMANLKKLYEEMGLEWENPDQGGMDIDDFNALMGYSEGLSFTINKKIYTGEALTAEFAGYRDAIQGALSRTPTFEGTTYRGLYFDTAAQAKAYADDFVVGEGVTFKAFTSSAKDTKAYSFDGYNRPTDVQLFINSKKGRDLTGESGGARIKPEKREVVHGLDTQFKVVKKQMGAGGQFQVWLEDI